MASAAPPPQDRKVQFVDKLKVRVQKDPVVFGFLGLTVAALTGGLFSLIGNDQRNSQRMMRFRVLFQLCTVGALIGGIYYRTYKESFDPSYVVPASSLQPAVDKRVYLLNSKVSDAIATVSASQGVATQEEPQQAEQLK